MPRVSIGIPIYYGENFLKETLESILSQDYIDYEIIITDNNPGGIAQKIAEAYSVKYDFIRYIKHNSNIGALQNWNSIIQYARGEYFLYAGAHDLLSDSFLSKCVEILDKEPEVAIAYAPTRFIDYNGNEIYREIGFLDTSGSSVVARLNQVLWANQEPLYGLMRTAWIRRTRLQKEIVGSGSVWLSEIALFGDFRVCTDVSRFRRENRDKQNVEEQLQRYHKTLFSKKRIRILPHWRIPWQYFLASFIGTIPLIRRLRILINMTTSALLRYLPNMIYDIKSLFLRLPKGDWY